MFIKPGLMFHRGNSKEILEEILSVALLSPVGFTIIVVCKVNNNEQVPQQITEPVLDYKVS